LIGGLFFACQGLIAAVQTYFARRYPADAAGERAQRALFRENAGDALADKAPCLGIAYPGRHDEHPPCKTELSGRRKKLRRPLAAEIVVQQDDINGLTLEKLQRIANCGAVGNLKARLRAKHPRDTLPKQGVIIHEQHANFPGLSSHGAHV
jgi:hypothetical protein